MLWPLAPAAAQRRSTTEDNTVKLTTKDGVQLKISYYPSQLGKEAVPVVMLHDFKESRNVFNSLARSLQKPSSSDLPSHAVITVDLRGHGESTKMFDRSGQTRELEAAKLGKRDFQSMVLQDMEAVRKFLVKKNDASELNLNKLCLLGSGMGANVATLWAAQDWSVPQLATRKQGRDVKGLVLVSPDWKFRGLPLLKSLKHPQVREEISMMVIYGKEDRKAAQSAETVYKNLERYHPEPPPEAGPESKTLVLISRPTSLEGTRLLTDDNFRVFPHVEFFIDARLAQQEFEWIPRK
jgi:pimeloyl-ACP methyl ester carboxylesterase